jgi:hypothetical protein
VGRPSSAPSSSSAPPSAAAVSATTAVSGATAVSAATAVSVPTPARPTPVSAGTTHAAARAERCAHAGGQPAAVAGFTTNAAAATLLAQKVLGLWSSACCTRLIETFLPGMPGPYLLRLLDAAQETALPATCAGRVGADESSSAQTWLVLVSSLSLQNRACSRTLAHRQQLRTE